MRHLVTTALSITLLLIGCSSPLNKAYDEKSLTADMVEVKKKLSEDDFNLLAGYLGLLKMGEALNQGMAGNTIGKTYKDLLEDAKKWKAELERQQAEQEALAEKTRLEEAERTQRLNQALTVAMVGKGFDSDEYGIQQWITFRMAYENKTDKEIRGFTGMLIITDLFDNLIMERTLTNDARIGPKSTLKDTRTIDYNQFDDESKALASKNYEDLKMIWKPEKILFSDGSILD